MKKILIFIFNFFIITQICAEDNLKFFIEKSISKNLKLNAERKNLESAKQNKNISRSEFLPSITISGDQTSTTSTNRTNQSGDRLTNSNSDTFLTFKSTYKEQTSVVAALYPSSLCVISNL